MPSEKPSKMNDVTPPMMNQPLPSIDDPEVIYVSQTRVACDGGDGALGHPRVFLNMGDKGLVDCGYCDRRYILIGGPADTRG